MEASVDSETTPAPAVSVEPATSETGSGEIGTEVAAAAPSTSTTTATTSKSSSRSSGKSAKAAAVTAANDGDGSAAKETPEKEERRSQKTSKSSRHNRSDPDNVVASGTEVEVKKFKKEPKEPTLNSDSGNRSTPTATATVTSSFAATGYPASSYLQGLASLPHPYASLFAAAADPATAAAANAFLTASHFGYASSTPTDLSSGKDNGSSTRNHNSGALLNSLNQTDTSALRQLVSGYREAAALLSRTADELESFLCTRK